MPSLDTTSPKNGINLHLIKSTLHSMLLYLHLAPVKLLLANAIGQRIVLSGTMPVWQTVLSLCCSSAAPRPIPDASVLR